MKSPRIRTNGRRKKESAKYSELKSDTPVSPGDIDLAHASQGCNSERQISNTSLLLLAQLRLATTSLPLLFCHNFSAHNSSLDNFAFHPSTITTLLPLHFCSFILLFLIRHNRCHRPRSPFLLIHVLASINTFCARRLWVFSACCALH